MNPEIGLSYKQPQKSEHKGISKISDATELLWNL